MQYQLILQFRGDAREQFDKIPDPVTALTEQLGDIASLDGEDVGAHGANVFLFTNDTQAAFDGATKVFPGIKATTGFAAAYRQICSEKFRSLWPAAPTPEFSLR